MSSVCDAVRPSVVFLQIEDAVCQGHRRRAYNSLWDTVERSRTDSGAPTPTPTCLLMHQVHTGRAPSWFYVVCIYTYMCACESIVYSMCVYVCLCVCFYLYIHCTSVLLGCTVFYVLPWRNTMMMTMTVCTGKITVNAICQPERSKTEESC